jgi:hypothetical protein
VKVPIALSLALIAGMIATGIAASLLFPRREPTASG